ncbi:MAG: hypothetical protein L0215_15305 [Gemmataceae bacterium]|nr:hypothetical protein [Gemmataceae bacterium]
MADEPANLSRVLLDGALELADALNQTSARYALIGGLAAGYRTHARFTRDVDFLLHIPQVALPPILTELARRGFEFDELSAIREWTQEHMTTLSYHGIRVDWLKPVIPAYLHILERATNENWLNHTIRVASAEGLILLKLLAFRTQDQLDIENLVAAQRDRLDLAWIRSEWQTLAPLDDPRMLRLMDLASGQKSS